MQEGGEPGENKECIENDVILESGCMNESEPIYANSPNIDSSTSVAVTGLEAYVAMKKSRKSILLEEYAVSVESV